MFKNLKEDSSILGDYFKKHILFYINKVTFKTRKKMNEKKLKKQTLVETLLEFEGAKKLGGEFMGKRYIQHIPVIFYRLKRHTTDGSPSYYYVAYLLRSKDNYQVVAEEYWDKFLSSIHEAAKTNKKAIIGIRKREGEYKNVKSRSRQGRKLL